MPMKYTKWDETGRTNILMVSNAFSIPRSTLRYWESAGLLSVDRRAQNNYRDFSYSDLIRLCDIVEMHNLGISIKRMREFPELSLHEIEQLYLEKDAELTRQIAKLEEILRKVRTTALLIKQFNELRRLEDARFSVPDIFQIIPHRNVYSRETWQKYFSGQYQFGNFQLSENGELFAGWITTEPENDSETLWEYRPDDRRFAECALSVSVKDRTENNFQKTRDRFSALGYRTGVIVSRYVSTAAEGKSTDFYKGWIEIF